MRMQMYGQFIRLVAVTAFGLICPISSWSNERDDVTGWDRFQFGMTFPAVQALAPDAYDIGGSLAIESRRIHGVHVEVGLLFSPSSKDLQVIQIRTIDRDYREKLTPSSGKEFVDRVLVSDCLATREREHGMGTV
jgi:hypothetical protein